jgi:Phytanoyl-CoA dioxygenase (PhyH)
MHLSSQQLDFFNMFGYLHLPRLFSPSEITAITAGFEESIQKHGGGGNHDGIKRTMFLGPIERIPSMNAIIDDPRITGPVGSILGDDFNYCSGDGNYYTGDTGWHPDGDWGRLFAIKIAFYLDPVRRDTGCLRVVPGSCHPNHICWKINMNQSKEQFGFEPRDFPGNVALESDPGDIVIFNHCLFHAAFGGGARRRMFTINCTRRAHDSADLETLRKYITHHTPSAYKIITGGGLYWQCFRDTATPARLRHMDQPDQLHDEIFPHLSRGKLQTT